MAEKNPQKKVLILCGDYMEDYEVMVPFQALLAYGVAVDAVCPGKKSGDVCRTAVHQLSTYQTYTETRGHNFILNATFDDIVASKYDGLVIPGGRSPEYLAMNESVLDLVRTFSTSGKPIASVCHGQLLLAAANCVKGRKCTAYPSLKPVLIAADAHWVEPDGMEACVVDGNLVTGATYVGHPEFIQLFVKALGGAVTGSDKRILFLCGVSNVSRSIEPMLVSGDLSEFLYAKMALLFSYLDFMEDYEVMVPFQSLQALGCHVDAVCPKKRQGETCATAIHDFEGDQTYSEKPGHDFTLTATFESIDASSYDGLVIPGGRAPEYLALDDDVITLVKSFMEAEKPVASICHGQQILSAAGVLKVIYEDVSQQKSNALVILSTKGAQLSELFENGVERRNYDEIHFNFNIDLLSDDYELSINHGLMGKKCTAYPAVKLNVVLGGGCWLEPEPIDRCFTDGNLVTGAAWPGHPEFISQFMALLDIRVSF
ncbi:hypothetical protein KSS87_013027 [Heliosperma pusillum]|nr:hypothetical protein KSS87_013027 [Heliosperma pusillum]